MFFPHSKPHSARPRSALLLFLFTLLATGCGGGGGGSASPGGSGGGSDTSGGTTAETAIRLTYPGDFPRSGSMPLSTGRYYTVGGLRPGYQYRVTIMTTDPIGFLYGDVMSCWGDTTCILTAPETGEISVHISFYDNDPDGARYTLNVEEVSHEGTPGAPQDLTGALPYTGTFKDGIYNYYVYQGLTPGNSYTFTDDGATVRIYQDQFAGDGFSNTSTFSGTQSFTAAGDTVWLRVSGSDQFTLTLTDNGLPDPDYAAEGTPDAPFELTLDTLHTGQTDNSASYYHIGGLSPNTEYGVDMDRQTGETVPVIVYNQPGYATEVCRDDIAYSGEGPQHCTARASDTGELWVKVDGTSTERLLGSGYLLGVYTYFPDEGSSSADKQLTFTGDIPYSGTVDRTSYYTVSGLENNTTYLATVTGYDAEASVKFNMAKAYNWMAGCVSREGTAGVQSCSLASHPDDGTISFEVTESTDFKGTAFTLSLERSAVQSEGTGTEPVLKTLVGDTLTYGGGVGAVDSYYEISGTIPGQAYTVSVAGLQSGQDIYLYDDPANLGSTYSSGYTCKDSGADAGCTIRATATSIWLRVGHDTYTPVNFTVDAGISPYQSEGSLDNPVGLTLGGSRSSMVDITESYYHLTGLTPNETYVVTATGVSADSSPVMYVYDDVSLFGSTTYLDYTCYEYLSTAAEYCTVTPTGTSVWIMVDGSDYGAGAIYTLGSAVATPAESFTLDYALPDTFPHSGTTDETASRYSVTNLQPWQYYQVTLSGLTADLDLSVSWPSGGSVTCTAATGTAVEVCDVITGYDSSMAVQVLGDKTLYGGSFSLNVTTGPENQGTSGDPVEVATNMVSPYTHSTGEVSKGDSYYRITGLVANTFYVVRMTGLTDVANLYLYEDGSFSTVACPSTAADTSDRACGATSDLNGELFVKVDGGATDTGATFSLTVEPGPVSEGSQGDEVLLAYATTSLPYNDGSVGGAESYYAISGLASSTAYNINFTVLSGSVSVLASLDLAFDSCSVSGGAGETVTCSLTTDKGGNTTYTAYVKVTGGSVGATYTIDVPTP